MKWATLCLPAILAACAGPGSLTPPQANDVLTTLQAATKTPIVGEYFSLADDSSVPWKNRLTPRPPLRQLNRLYLNAGWLKPDSSGKYVLAFQFAYEAPRFTQVLKLVRSANPKAQLFIVSGFDSNGAMYRAALENPQYYAKSVVAFVRKYKLDGYDCDWENGLDAKGLNTLSAAVRSALQAASAEDGKSYAFTIAVWPTPEQGSYDLPRLAKLVDQIEIMSYGRLRKLGPEAQAYVKGGIPARKIIGGIVTERDYREEGGVDTLGAKGTIAQKATYATSNGLAGMMAWRLDNDYVENKTPTYAGARELWKSMTLFWSDGSVSGVRMTGR
jgi:hypothetical protein